MAESPKSSGLVNVKVFVKGKELPGDFPVYSIDVTKEINKIAGATIKFLDGNPSTQDFILSNKADLNPGNEIEIQAGYDTDAKSIFKGIIIRHGVKARGTQSHTVVECKDRAILMTIENRSDIYEKKKDSEAINAITKRYKGLNSRVASTRYQHAQLVQYDCTDWDFVVLRAELNGQIITTIDNTLIAEKPKIARPSLELEFGTSILEFDADVDATSQLSRVIAQSWDVKSQKIAKKEITSSDFEDTGELKSATLAKDMQTGGYSLFHPGNLDISQLEEWGSSVMLKHKMSKLSGKIRCQGFGKIQPADTIELKGVGKKFNGKLFVSKVSHELHAGQWFTDIHFGGVPKLQSEKFDIGKKEASGILPAIHGLHIGVVKKINDDPDNQYRIQVSLPIFGSKLNVWARKAHPDAGKDRGVYFMPEVNDEVIIGFLNDDARYPVIMGSLFSSKNATPVKTDEKNTQKGLFTKENLKLVMDDQDKKVMLSTPAKQEIEIDDKSGSVSIKDKNGNTVTMKSNLIELESKGDLKISAGKNVTISGMKISIDAKTDVAINGTNIKQNAKAQFQAKGSAKAEISAGGQAVLKGGAMVQVQGALVKIN